MFVKNFVKQQLDLQNKLDDSVKRINAFQRLILKRRKNNNNRFRFTSDQINSKENKGPKSLF